jgi:hypothetical protein
MLSGVRRLSERIHLAISASKRVPHRTFRAAAMNTWRAAGLALSRSLFDNVTNPP